MQRLSSGLRINSAKDDAAGLAISDRMTSQIRGLNQAARNANDAISLAQTAEGSLQEGTKLLQRMRDLSVQSANDSNSAVDRANLQKEVSQLQQELDRIANDTAFNGKKLLDGSFTSQSFHVGANANQSISITLGDARASQIGNNAVTADGTLAEATASAAALPGSPVVGGEDLALSGYLGTASVDVQAGDSAKTIAARVNSETGNTGVEASAMTRGRMTVSGAGTIAFSLTNALGTATIKANVADNTDLKALADAINDQTATTGITATADGANLNLVSTTGENIGISNFGSETDATATAGITGTLQALSADGTATNGAQETLTQGGNDSSQVGGHVSFSSPETFSVTSGAAGGLFTTTGANNSTLDAVSSIDIGTQQGANDALAIIDSAIQFIDNSRGDLGAIQNRLESTVANLDNISENLSAARSRVLDADYAMETASLTRQQILQQAGVAMLAQANQSPQVALSLLQ